MINLTTEMLLLKVSQDTVRCRRKSEGKLEPYVTTKLSSAQLANRSSVITLGHTKDPTNDPEAERDYGCNSERKLLLAHVVFWVITGETTLEENVLT